MVLFFTIASSDVEETSHVTRLEKESLFHILVNLCFIIPSMFFTLVKYYFEVSFDLKLTLYIEKKWLDI